MMRKFTTALQAKVMIETRATQRGQNFRRFGLLLGIPTLVISKRGRKK